MERWQCKMEDMEIEKLFGAGYKNRRVLITGHTGFKGSWLAQWLFLLGAKVAGYALPPKTNPSHFGNLNLDITSHFGDIIDYDELSEFITGFSPEIVFHLAAQPIVLESYNNPVYTYNTNVMGTVNLLECCRKTDSIKSVVVITTDKVYEDDGRHDGYTETDRLAGFDPYSASKACVEILCDSYRKSFFSEKGKLLATARAGNVLGGGDWAEYRLLPDIIRSVYLNENLEIRNPQAIRPWQHVLDPLAGYLLLGSNLLEGKYEFATAWNFGPGLQNCLSVADIVKLAESLWGNIKVKLLQGRLHETDFLKLDCSKAITELGWKPLWDIEKTITTSINWYKSFYTNHELLTLQDIEQYIDDAKIAELSWTK
jgi:CDP-glucose 4,6-dehydratase